MPTSPSTEATIKRLIVLDEHDDWSSQGYWQVVDDILRQLGGDQVVLGASQIAGADLSNAVVVTLGKKAAEAALQRRINFNEEVGNEHVITDSAGHEATLLVQYHPTVFLRSLEFDAKGGAHEKTKTLWYDLWDGVQLLISGGEQEPPPVSVLSSSRDIITVLNHLHDNYDGPLSYDYETWGDVDARRPELNKDFRVLTIGVAFSEPCGWCTNEAEPESDDPQCICGGTGKRMDAFSFPLDAAPGVAPHFTDREMREICKSWCRLISRPGGVAHNSRYEYKVNRMRFGPSAQIHCTMLMDAVLDELQKHSLERVLVRCGVPWAAYKRRAAQLRANPAAFPLEKVLEYVALDALGTLYCYYVMLAQLAVAGLMPVYDGDELISPSLAKIELAGMRSDIAEAGKQRERAEEQLKGMRAELASMPEVKRTEAWAVGAIKSFKNGDTFNPKSPVQMRRLILHEVGVPVKPQKDGGYKLDKRGLEPFEEEYPFCRKLNAMRSLSSMKTGFLDKWESFIGPDGNIHSQYQQAEVVTGRLSSKNPPQQNMPKGTEVRRAIISRFSNGRLVEGDFVQQEPRLLAGWSQDATMIEEIAKGTDLHGFVASRIFNVEYRGKETEYREKFGKRMNLGIMYGQTEYGLAFKTGISIERARELLAEYDQLFPDVAKWRYGMHRFAIQHGYVEDLFGARRHLPGARSTDEWEVRRALRQASNFPIQSTANRFTLFSLVVAHAVIEREGLDDRIVMCGTIHDSIIADSADGYGRRAGEILEYALTMHNEQSYWSGRGVPMAAEIKIGPNLKDTAAIDVRRAA